MDDLEDSSDCHNHPEHQSLDQYSVQERFSLADLFLICKEVDRYFIDQALCYLTIFLEDETSKYFSLIRFSLPVGPAIVFVVATIVDVIDIVDLIWIEIIGFH